MLALRTWLATIFEDQAPRSSAARVSSMLLTRLMGANVRQRCRRHPGNGRDDPPAIFGGIRSIH
jgi:hypothetical protein